MDSRLQVIAQRELARRLREVPMPNDHYAHQRRGAVVLLNARTGAILAAASHPSPPAATTRWDRVAFAETWPYLDPFRFTPGRDWTAMPRRAPPSSW